MSQIPRLNGWRHTGARWAVSPERQIRVGLVAERTGLVCPAVEPQGKPDDGHGEVGEESFHFPSSNLDPTIPSTIILHMAGDKPISRQRRWQIAQKAKGMCMYCSQPSEQGYDSGLCRKHRDMNTERQRERKVSRFLNSPDDGEDE